MRLKGSRLERERRTSAAMVRLYCRIDGRRLAPERPGRSARREPLFDQKAPAGKNGS